MTLEDPTIPGHAASVTGRIVALHVSPGPGSRSTPRAVDSVVAHENRGLEGDRHARAGTHRSVLLVEAEVLDALGLEPGTIREQVTVRGLALDALPDGARLTAGTALFEVGIPCDPCGRMEEIRPGLRAALEGRRGRFVRVVRTGTITVGDAMSLAGAPQV
jgi:MOSC domain-containing protein YiiM